MFNTRMRATVSAAGIWYKHFERPLSSVSLIGGFVFDAITLKRLDAFWENFWVVVHLAVVAICILLLNRDEKKEDLRETDPQRHFWYVNTLQFFFGGLLSTFLVFYFRSATLAVSWPFLLILLAAFVANESLKRHYAKLTFQISLFYLSLYLFAIYIMPILVRRIGPLIFLISGFVSLLLVWAYLRLLERSAGEEFVRTGPILFRVVGGMFLMMNLLYFFHLIPPIPLSLRDAGIYQSIAKQADGNYVAQGEDQGIFRYLRFHENIHLPPGSPVYAYTAVFSPTALRTDVVHEWERYDERTRRWVVESRVNLPVSGGRDGGYRTFSIKKGVTPGLWRVNVETPRGEVLGRLRFYVSSTSDKVNLKVELKD